jgi:hypothetical protein
MAGFMARQNALLPGWRKAAKVGERPITFRKAWENNERAEIVENGRNSMIAGGRSRISARFRSFRVSKPQFGGPKIAKSRIDKAPPPPQLPRPDF